MQRFIQVTVGLDAWRPLGLIRCSVQADHVHHIAAHHRGLRCPGVRCRDEPSRLEDLAEHLGETLPAGGLQKPLRNGRYYLLTGEGGRRLLQRCCGLRLLADPSTNDVSSSARTLISPADSPKSAICSHRTRSPSYNCRLPRPTAGQMTLCPSGAA